jgi:3-oxoacyl-[acyl-carrier-protein] synthase III
MTTAQAASILGCGYRVPRRVRRNDDPIYDQLDTGRDRHGVTESHAFDGLDRRRYLGPEEEIEPLMAEACREAVDRAGLALGDIDRLYGYTSVSTYLTPNSLFRVHAELGLSIDTMVVPINVEYSTFSVALVHAAEAITAGHSAHALVVCGSNWTRHADYTRGHAFSIGDGAGAVVVGPGERAALLDHRVQTLSRHYQGMTMAVRPAMIMGRPHLPVDEQSGLPVATYEMNETGMEILATTIRDGVPDMVLQMLDRHGLTGDDIALITHQGSRLMMDHWAARIGPREYLETLAEYGNMVMASYPVNLAHFYDDIGSDHIVIAAPGCGMHLSTLLMRRN